MAEPEETHRGREVATSGRELPEGYLEQYKLFVEMTDRVSARRAVASSFFLTAQSALVVLLGVISKEHWLLAGSGLIVAITWWMQLRSYRQLNEARFRVIHEMEKRLPAAPYTDEWAILKPPDVPQRWCERYTELGVLERIVPVVFGALFLGVLIAEVI